jgi:Uma2 family endonuclease
LIAEDEMGVSRAQSRLILYLIAVLEWLYRAEGWQVLPDLTFYHPAIRNSQQMISPDVAVFKGLVISEEEQDELTSWDMRPGHGGNPPHEGRACPPVLLEVSSKGTWHTDIGAGEQDKPALYGAIGAREYFAYDPNHRRVWTGHGGRRLLGWRYDGAGRPAPLVPDGRGWLWSAELDSWLGPDGPLLRLYDAQGRRRLTGEEAEAAARRRLEEQLATLRAALRERNIDPDRF